MSGVSGMSTRPEVWREVSSGASLEERVAAIEVNLDRVREWHNETRVETGNGLTRLTNAIEQEKKDRATGDKVIEQKLKEAETGGYYVSWVGVWFLFVGSVMSTGSLELVEFARLL